MSRGADGAGQDAPGDEPGSETGRAFLREARELLRDRYVPWILRCLEESDEEDLWWRPNDVSNAVGNLVHHVAGNAGQWIVSGVGGEPDVRARSEEFARREGSPEDVREVLVRTFDAVDRTLADLDPARLTEPVRVQGMDRTVLAAVQHVVEHVAYHAGQIVYVTKARTGRTLDFYRISPEGDAEEAW